MSEQKHEIKLQDHEIKLQDGDWKLSVTKQEAQDIRDQCDAILARKAKESIVVTLSLDELDDFLSNSGGSNLHGKLSDIVARYRENTKKD